MTMDQLSAGIATAVADGAAGSISVKIKVAGVEHEIQDVTFVRADHQVAPEEAAGPNYLRIDVVGE